jgi:4-alpha-glucanotransferase
MSQELGALQELAQLHGVYTSYDDVTGQRQVASPEALLLVLGALGAPVGALADVPDALSARRQSQWRRRLEPVTVVWNEAASSSGRVELRLPASFSARNMACGLRLETGEKRRWTCALEQLPIHRTENVAGIDYVARSLPLPEALPLGYHRLELELGEEPAECLILSAPARAYESAESARGGLWGVFLPLYALHSERSWGAGDFSDLQTLTDWVNSLGGGMVATLPLLAAFLDEPFEPGPYSPASRLFWNEFYLDVCQIPGWQHCSAAQSLLAAQAFQREIGDLRNAELVDYRRQMALKRRVLSELARCFFALPGAQQARFHRWLAERPLAEDYARFRAVGERRRAPWPAWPAPLRDGVVHEGDYDEEVRRYHLFVQWQADEQLQSLASKARTRGPGLYLDLPLGVNPDSYDVWRERDAFASGMAAGAPPDPFFAKGQNWGFPPLHPEGIRAQGYRHVIQYVQHHLRLAGILRIDHMMGFHRLFWIPHGLDARAGVYVRYSSEELYALFNLESHRHRSVLVGEDLGTVPAEVPVSMASHNVHRMYVSQYEVQPQYQSALTAVYPGCVASLNTHDMPPFAAFWQGLDIQDRVELGILEPATADEERTKRQRLLDALVRSLREGGYLKDAISPHSVLKACLAHLSTGPGMVVVANLEDLWLEINPQNVPGTWRERPNWRRRARYSVEAFTKLPEVVEVLRFMEGLRREIGS